MSEIVVLDTHIWIWWLNNNEQLSKQAINYIETAPRVLVSVVSCFEIAQLVKRQRLILPISVESWLQEALIPAGVELLALSPAIACRAVNLTDIHKDPFDRIIIASALEYQAKLMSVDGHFKNYPELHDCLITNF
jgi:PIN domain nuclease of toxin-antitoxin system